MQDKAQSWKSQLLSHAGKDVLLKSVIQAIPSYIMSLFAQSKGLIKRMNAILRQFFWSGYLKKRAIHWTNADNLCSPKSLGRHILIKGAFKAIGDGETVSLLTDLWIPQLAPMKVNRYTGPFEVASDWIKEGTRECDRELITLYCPHYQSEFIFQIPIGPP
ncbi:Putative ribonuclease H protein At1g65750, partial [Linum perenne]